MIQRKDGEISLPGLKRHTGDLFSFYLSYDKPCGKLALGQICIKIISDISNSVAMVLRIQTDDIEIKCHVRAKAHFPPHSRVVPLPKERGLLSRTAAGNRA